MKSLFPVRVRLLGATACCIVLASGCASLLPKPAAPALTYALDGEPRAHAVLARLASPRAPGAMPTLIVSAPRAAPGYDGPQMVYVRVAHQLEHFAHSEWADTPARMLAPLIVAALEDTPGLRVVGPASGSIMGDLRLDTEVLQLQQAFGAGPSRARFALRATLVDTVTRQVISSRVFDESMASASEDAYGGVVAANRAVQQVMDQLSRHCALAAESWTEARGRLPRPNGLSGTGP
jgi:cholesterol transport system auxiliary component